VAKTKLPDYSAAGRATVFIFPDLSRGCTVPDIGNTVPLPPALVRMTPLSGP